MSMASMDITGVYQLGNTTELGYSDKEWSATVIRMEQVIMYSAPKLEGISYTTTLQWHKPSRTLFVLLYTLKDDGRGSVWYETEKATKVHDTLVRGELPCEREGVTIDTNFLLPRKDTKEFKILMAFDEVISEVSAGYQKKIDAARMALR